MYTNLIRDCCTGTDFYTLNYPSIPLPPFCYSSFCSNCSGCYPVPEIYKMPPKMRAPSDALYNSNYSVPRANFSRPRRRQYVRRVCDSGSNIHLPGVCDSDQSIRPTRSEPCCQSLYGCKICAEANRIEGGGSELQLAEKCRCEKCRNAGGCSHDNQSKSNSSGQQDRGIQAAECCCECCKKRSVPKSRDLNDGAHAGVCHCDANGKKTADTERFGQDYKLNGKEKKAIEGSCAGFLNAVCDSILVSVQKSIDNKLKEFNCQATAKFESLSRKLENNEAAIKYLCNKLMEKMSEENQTKFEEVFSLVQNLIAAQSRPKQTSTIEKECQCEYPKKEIICSCRPTEAHNQDTVSVTSLEAENTKTDNLPKSDSDNCFANSLAEKRLQPSTFKNIMKKDTSEGRKPPQKVTLCLEAKPSTDSIPLKTTTSRFSMTGPAHEFLLCNCCKGEDENSQSCACNVVNSDTPTRKLNFRIPTSADSDTSICADADNDTDKSKMNYSNMCESYDTSGYNSEPEEDSNEPTVSNYGRENLLQHIQRKTPGPIICNVDSVDQDLGICNEIADLILRRNILPMPDEHGSFTGSELSREEVNRVLQPHARLAKAIQWMLRRQRYRDKC